MHLSHLWQLQPFGLLQILVRVAASKFSELRKNVSLQKSVRLVDRNRTASVQGQGAQNKRGLKSVGVYSEVEALSVYGDDLRQGKLGRITACRYSG